MLNESHKLTIAANILHDSLDSFKSISQNKLKGCESWEDFYDYCHLDFEYAVDKCNYIFESFPMLLADATYCEVYQNLNSREPWSVFQLYGQPEKAPSYFLFKEFRYQTEVEAKKSNDLAMEILNEILQDEAINNQK